MGLTTDHIIIGTCTSKKKLFSPAVGAGASPAVGCGGSPAVGWSVRVLRVEEMMIFPCDRWCYNTTLNCVLL